jgi:class 3 adenylate cyclase
MRVRRLFERTRPFRYAGFWTLALVCATLPFAPDGPGAWQIGVCLIFCAVWPPLADRLRGLAGRAPWPGDPARLDRIGYGVEAAGVMAVLAWASLPAVPTAAAALCLLTGALALAGPGLLLRVAAGALVGFALGTALGPGRVRGAWLPGDVLAVLLMIGFSLAVAALAYRQTRRLHAERMELARRSADLQRLTERMERYLPPSLRARLTAAPDAPCRWERCWLSVAFVDLVGFTALAERLEAEALAAVLDDYLVALSRAAERHGGEVSKLLGDGVLVVFGTGAAPSGTGQPGRRDRALGAVSFCRAAAPLLAELSERWCRRGEPVRLAVRAGVASGYCTLGDRGGAGRLDFTLVGSPVNLASRLQSLAEPGGVLVDAATAAVLDGAVDLGGPRRLDVRGLGPQHAYAVAALGEAAAAAQTGDGAGRGRVDPGSRSAIVPAPACHT